MLTTSTTKEDKRSMVASSVAASAVAEHSPAFACVESQAFENRDIRKAPGLGTPLCRGPSGSPRAFRVSECLGLDRGERWGVNGVKAFIPLQNAITHNTM